MPLEKLPPIEKIYEAFSVLADNRIVMQEQQSFITSSDYTKRYMISFDSTTYASNDSATYWQGYPGYPIIAVWMKQGILNYDEAMIQHFKAIPWKRLNASYKRKYDIVVKQILTDLAKQGVDTDAIEASVQTIFNNMKELSYEIKKNTKKSVKL